MSIPFKEKGEIETDIERIKKILGCGIFEVENSRHPLYQSAFIELVLRLRDLLAKSERFGKRINFSDDVIVMEYQYGGKKKKISDITDAVTYGRDAACHVDSDKNKFDDNIIFIFNVVYGRGNLIVTLNKTHGSDYEGELCFFYGEQKLYFNRHILRAFKEAKDFLEKLII